MQTGLTGIVLLTLAAAGGLLVGRLLSRLIMRSRGRGATKRETKSGEGPARERSGRSPARTQRRGGRRRQAKRGG